ncbi:MAG: glycosyltransferase/methyltransferase [Archangium gephyra]|uniref:Glycosyltransferase/methyltransferase n=1 Tax=Archangium gephyra TaxID=48 RepID=A0A2W5TGJ5_9BACT|nr:MAG: glycosyltransferase/methyltransferase [Archangium gephyra]
MRTDLQDAPKPRHDGEVNPGTKAKTKVCIFVIAYQAEATLRSVLDRIPRSFLSEFDCEILVVDDASSDRTADIGREYRDENRSIHITVLRNEFNQGYGGNQKVGYSYAVKKGFDFVAMVHGDGQYAPEQLPNLIAPLVSGEADAVFGSRMMTRFGALKGGMPLYKYVGNKILTTAQNALLGSKLSEFHSGYRVYSCRALRQLPFDLNSNDFHFDTEIIIQFLNAKLRIKELPIPTYYGDEISRVNGMKYAKDVMIATVQNSLHRSGLLYQRRFDKRVVDNAHYELKLGYPSSHQYALDAVPGGESVLDIGGGPGGIAQAFKNKHCKVAVVDQFEPRNADPEVKVFVRDLDEGLDVDVSGYRYLLLLDVIEHLKNPEAFVEGLRRQFTFEPKTLVLTTPNVAFAVQRLMLLAGQFNYGKAGILDRTHTRLFTFRSIEQLLKDAGFRVKEVRGVPAPFPRAVGDNVLGRGLTALNAAAIRVSKTLFSYQIMIVAESTPDVQFVLEAAKKSSAR